MSRAVDDMNGRISQIMTTVPYGLARSEAARLLVAEIEESGPEECLAYALYALTDAYAVSGEPDRSLVSFAKLSRWWDAHPERFDSYDQVQSIRTYNLVINALRSYPSIPLEHITSALDELEGRTALVGVGRRVWAIERYMWADYLGAPDRDERFLAWQREPRDNASYPEAVESWITSHYLFESEKVDEGIRVARKALDDSVGLGDRSNLLARLQHVFLVAGRVEEARAAHISSVQHMSEGPARAFMSRARASNIAFLARSQNVTRCLAMLHAEHDLLSTTENSPNVRWSVFTTLGAATTILMALGNGGSDLSLVTSSARTVAELNDWLRAQVTDLTEQFDKRNGTLEFSRQATLAWSAEPASDRVDLSIQTTPSGRTSPPHSVSSDSEGTADDSSGVTTSSPTLEPQITISRPPQELRALSSQARKLSLSAPAEAVAQFVAIGSDYESQGLLVEAGKAFIEAAQLAERSADPAGGLAGHRYGNALLAAGGASLIDRAQGAQNLARALVNWGEADQAIETLTLMNGVLEEALAAAPVSEVNLRTQLTELLDSQARVLATAGRGKEALELAKQAAQAFAGLSRWTDAAYSFLLAGRISRDSEFNNDQTRWLFESAVEGFSLAHNKPLQNEATADLIEFLHGMGLLDEAQKLSSRLTDRTYNRKNFPHDH